MTRSRPTLLAAALLLALLASGCALFTKGLAKPTVDVRGVAVASVTFTGAEGQLDLDITNPNGFGVPLSGIDWELTIGGARAVSGRVELSQTIPAKGVAPVVATLRIGATEAVGVASELASGVRTYQLSARLHFTSPLGPITVDVAHQGDLADAAALVRR